MTELDILENPAPIARGIQFRAATVRERSEGQVTRFGEILQTCPSPLTGSRSKPKPCARCGKVRSLGLFDKCGQCYRKMMFEAMPADEKEHSIAAVVPPRYLEALLEHLPAKLQEIIKTLPEDKGLLLWGAPGVGKTYAMAALPREYLSQGFTAARTGYEMLCLQLRDTFKSKAAETELSVIKPYLQADKLFIEDIGTTKSEGALESDFSVRTLLVLLDYRLENCLATFLTGNRPVEELAKTFDERVASRLLQACEVVKLTGADKRKRDMD